MVHHIQELGYEVTLVKKLFTYQGKHDVQYLEALTAGDQIANLQING